MFLFEIYGTEAIPEQALHIESDLKQTFPGCAVIFPASNSIRAVRELICIITYHDVYEYDRKAAYDHVIKLLHPPGDQSPYHRPIVFLRRAEACSEDETH